MCRFVFFSSFCHPLLGSISFFFSWRKVVPPSFFISLFLWKLKRFYLLISSFHPWRSLWSRFLALCGFSGCFCWLLDLQIEVPLPPFSFLLFLLYPCYGRPFCLPLAPISILALRIDQIMPHSSVPFVPLSLGVLIPPSFLVPDRLLWLGLSFQPLLSSSWFMLSKYFSKSSCLCPFLFFVPRIFLTFLLSLSCAVFPAEAGIDSCLVFLFGFPELLCWVFLL